MSVGVVRKLERGGTALLPSLLAIASALGTDIAVLLGQQAPRRAMDRDERAALRTLSAATHDAAIGIIESDHSRRIPAGAGAALVGLGFYRGGWLFSVG